MAPSEVADRRLAGLRLLYRPPPPTQESRDRDPAAGSHRPDGSPVDRRAGSMTATTGQAAPDDKLQAAQRLYEAFAAHDARALLALLIPGFRGVVSEGMPDGLGGTYDGAEAMLRECWARVFALLDLRPVPAE